MKSFEQIAKAMYEAYAKTKRELGYTSRILPWAALLSSSKDAWIAAAQVAHKEMMEVH